MSYRIGFIGAGRVAWHLAPALKNAGHQIVQIISHSEKSAKRLGDRVGCDDTGILFNQGSDIQILFLTTGDDALVEIIREVTGFQGVVVITSGTFSLNRFNGTGLRSGVLYPLQTFSFERELDLKEVPVFIEGCNPEVTDILVNLASGFSNEVYKTRSDERKWIHLAAVWANNFSNHMLANAFGIMNEHSLPVKWLEPLIRETFSKAMYLGPQKSQTGPAVRHDQMTILKQLDLLSYSRELQVLYQSISDSIQSVSGEEKNNQL
ncbi:MAG: DUF2520 domain-containing protein [Bacteroidales bacterium]|nr:DUF2520 domain-containing protein [Bacteroidales bacterium]